jgi:hypothetical protein
MQGLEAVVKQLQVVLLRPRTKFAEAMLPMRLLLQLQEDGTPTTLDLDPVRLYLDSQVHHCLHE